MSSAFYILNHRNDSLESGLIKHALHYMKVLKIALNFLYFKLLNLSKKLESSVNVIIINNKGIQLLKIQQRFFTRFQ